MKPTLEQIKTGSDWLQVNSKVMTPKGTATVNKITEDDGVFTTLGNYCRSELSPSKAFVPEVGTEFEYCNPSRDDKYHRCFFVGYDADGDMVVQREDGLKGLKHKNFNLEFRPIKSESERFIEAVSKILQLHDQDVTDLCNKSVNMFRSQAEALYDSGKFKLVEAEE